MGENRRTMLLCNKLRVFWYDYFVSHKGTKRTKECSVIQTPWCSLCLCARKSTNFYDTVSILTTKHKGHKHSQRKKYNTLAFCSISNRHQNRNQQITLLTATLLISNILRLRNNIGRAVVTRQHLICRIVADELVRFRIKLEKRTHTHRSAVKVNPICLQMFDGTIYRLVIVNRSRGTAAGVKPYSFLTESTISRVKRNVD